MEEREAEAVTKEQVYQKQMEDLGTWQEIFMPELRTLCRCERELTRAEKAWSATAAPGEKPSFLNDHYQVIQKLRAEILQHREALGLTPKALKKLVGVAGTDAPNQQDLITNKLDQIAARVAGYDFAPGSDVCASGLWIEGEDGVEKIGSAEVQIAQDMYETLPEAQEAARISDLMDEELRRAVHEDMG